MNISQWYYYFFFNVLLCLFQLHPLLFFKFQSTHHGNQYPNWSLGQVEYIMYNDIEFPLLWHFEGLFDQHHYIYNLSCCQLILLIECDFQITKMSYCTFIIPLFHWMENMNHEHHYSMQVCYSITTTKYLEKVQ